MTFINLHVHDEFSQLDGFGTAEAYAERAKFLNQTALASTNHGNVDGLLKHQKACAKVGIKPILGCELYVVPNPLVKQKDERRGHMVVLVRNGAGWVALCRLLSRANLEGFYYRPRVGFQWIMDLTDEEIDGLVFLTGCMGSFLRLPGGTDVLSTLNQRGAKVYLEVQPWPHEDQCKWNVYCNGLSVETDIPLVATNDTHYVVPDDARAQEVLLSIQRKAKWSDPSRFRFEFDGLHLRSEREMRRAFHKFGGLTEPVYEAALARTQEVADLCDFTIPTMPINLPQTRHENDVTADKALWRLVQQGLKRVKECTPQYLARIEEEYKVITDKQFERYFLMVYDFVNFCRENGIVVGPGRGSVGGSLLAYLLHITDVDPLEYNLLFSRFINPERNDYPDIDIDVESRRREETRLYLEKEYGLNHIAGISTFGRMKGRTVIRDVARVFEVPYKEVDTFAKSLPQSSEKVKDSIRAAAETEAGREFATKYPMVVDIAARLEGQVRTSGQHPAALIVSGDDLTETGRCVVVERDGARVINWDMEDSEYVGLVKLDDLRLDTLSVIGHACELIKQKGEPIDLVSLEMNDNEVFDMLSSGRTCGVFQLSGWACKRLCIDMGIHSFDDIAAVTALARPGPMNSGMTPDYVARKKSGHWERSPYPQYAAIVENTYGVLVYQEQVMRVFTDMAGLTAGTADKIRKVIGKKRDASEFEPYREQFVAGCRDQKTFTEAEANEFWAGLLRWAEYGFNLSHSVEYGMIAYWTAWLKRYHPREYAAAFLTYGEEGQKAEMMAEAQEYAKLKVVTPKVGVSDADKWMVEGDYIYMPFKAIKGVGDSDAAKCRTLRPPVSVGAGLAGFFNMPAPEATKDKKGTSLQILLDEVKAFDPDPAVMPDDFEKYFGCGAPGSATCYVQQAQPHTETAVRIPDNPVARRSLAPQGVARRIKPRMNFARSEAYVKIHMARIQQQVEYGCRVAKSVVTALSFAPGATGDPVAQKAFCEAVEQWIQTIERGDDIPF